MERSSRGRRSKRTVAERIHNILNDLGLEMPALKEKIQSILIKIPPSQLVQYCAMHETVAKICADDIFVQRYRQKYSKEIQGRLGDTIPWDYMTHQEFTKNTNVTPKMRKILVSWMCILADDANIGFRYFFDAVSALDRYLYTSRGKGVTSNNLQSLGAACLHFVDVEKVAMHPKEYYIHMGDGAVNRQDLDSFTTGLTTTKGAIGMPTVMNILENLDIEETSYYGVALYILCISVANVEYLRYEQPLIVSTSVVMARQIQKSVDMDISLYDAGIPLDIPMPRIRHNPLDRLSVQCFREMSGWVFDLLERVDRGASSDLYDLFMRSKFNFAAEHVLAPPIFVPDIALEKTKLTEDIPDIYDVIEMESTPADEYLRGGDLRVVLVIGKTSLGFSRSDLKNITGVSTKVQDFFYECPKKNEGLSVKKEVLEGEPYVIIRCTSMYYVKASEMIALLYSPQQVFVLEPIKKLGYTANIDVINFSEGRTYKGEDINVVSKDHCQENTGKMLYGIKIAMV